jgi:hypothetical protein
MENAEFLKKFNELETVEIYDTYTLHIINEANQIEAFLNSFDQDALTELESLELKMLADEWVEKMNSECPYMGQQVAVTGDVMTAKYEQFTDVVSVDEVPYTNQAVTSDGFRVLMRVNDEGKRLYVAGHYFRTETLEPRNGGPAFTDSIRRLYGFAPVGSVDIVADIPENRHAGVLYRSIPDIIESVNYEIGQAQDEADALCRLRSIVVKNAVDIPRDTINDLLNYIYDCLGMDETVPYQATLRGAVYRGELGKNGGLAFELYNNNAPPVLVSPIELRLAQYPKRVRGGYEIGETDHFLVKLKLIGESSDSRERTIFAPVRNIKSLRSLRKGAATSDDKWYRA